MLRLSDDELAVVAAHKPSTAKLAVFARTVLLDSLGRPPAERVVGPADLRRAVAFVVACLSPDISLDRAGELFDQWATAPHEEELKNGAGDESGE